MRLDVRDIPLAAIDAISGGLGLAGSLSGSAIFTGSAGSAKISFDLTAARATADAARQAGIPPIGFAASGTFENGTVSIKSQTIDPQGLRLQVTGQVNVGDSPTLDLSVGGTMLLDLFADELARRGLRAAGTVTPDLTISGSLPRPDIAGSVDIDNATFGDADGRFTIRNATARLIVKDDSVELVSLTGSAGGGSLSATGRAGLRADSPVEGNIEIRKRPVRGRHNDHLHF